MGETLEVALAFVEAVNAGSIDRLAVLMSDDHLFIDSDGGRYHGRSAMMSGWTDYLAMVPDYRIIVKETFAGAGTVMLSGEAEGTFVQNGVLRPENHWRVPAAWRAVVKGGKIAVWQVYVNPESMTGILKRIRGE